MYLLCLTIFLKNVNIQISLSLIETDNNYRTRLRFIVLSTIILSINNETFLIHGVNDSAERDSEYSSSKTYSIIIINITIIILSLILSLILIIASQ